MKHVILLLLLSLSSLLAAQSADTSRAPLILGDPVPGAIVVFNGYACYWQSPATSSTTAIISGDSPAQADIIGDFRFEYREAPLDTFAVYLGGGVLSESITWESGLISSCQIDTSEIVQKWSSATYYPVVISDFLKVQEVVDSAGVSYHFQCNEDVSDIIAEPCYALRNVPFLLSCDYPASNTLRLRFDPTIRLDWARELATGAAMTHFYPVWISRK